MIREQRWADLCDGVFDVVILGGGINGASIFRRLSHEGYRVLLLDRGDFSCGTSQASAMMVWGGLLYLKNLELKRVMQFSRDRDKMLSMFDADIQPQEFRYIVNREYGRPSSLVLGALWSYWLMGRMKRKRPRYEKSFTESSFLNMSQVPGSLVYEEGVLKFSDSRFVLNWILENQTDTSIACNYCEVSEVKYNEKDRKWSVGIEDRFTKRSTELKTRMVLNCTGVWTDRVNKQFNKWTSVKHVFSKGVFLGLPKAEVHKNPLIFEMGNHGDTLTCIPWGPISLWGPTENLVESIEEGYQVNQEDISFLRDHAKEKLGSSFAQQQAISLRCGIRPLVVDKSFEGNCYPLEISRGHKIIKDLFSPWYSIYGGKISGCLTVAEEVLKLLTPELGKPTTKEATRRPVAVARSKISYPNLSKEFISLKSSVEHEFCCTLDDYLRRRTNISQWVPREGFGFHNENWEFLKGLVNDLPKAYIPSPEEHLGNFDLQLKTRFDPYTKS
ncbi:MAG: FAD-dependent oxidoreductase [Lentisphaeria bacterium]|nr:FAD-dependent oxidoreductase [Lentisphaeria bacterium]